MDSLNLISHGKNIKDKSIIEAEQRKTTIGYATNFLIPGLTLWEYKKGEPLNVSNVYKADFSQTSVNTNSDSPKLALNAISADSIELSHKVDMKPGHIYVQALNKKNAVRKFESIIKHLKKLGLSPTADENNTASNKAGLGE